MMYQRALGLEDLERQDSSERNTLDSNRLVDVMHYYDEGTIVPEIHGREWYLPTWQTSPYVREGLVNNNLLRYENNTLELERVLTMGSAATSQMFTSPPGDMNSTDATTALLAALRTAQAGTPTEYLGDPMTNLYIPIFEGFGDLKRKVVGVLTAMIHWKSYFRNVLPQSIQGIVVVLEYDCGNAAEEEEAPKETINQRRT